MAENEDIHEDLGLTDVKATGGCGCGHCHGDGGTPNGDEADQAGGCGCGHCHGGEADAVSGCRHGCGMDERFHRLPPAPVAFALGLLTGADLALKFLAVRRAIKRGDRAWVLPLALINTAGVLPAVFLKTHPLRRPGHGLWHHGR